MELEKELTESQGERLIEYLDSAIRNKQHPHPADLRRAAVILYKVNQLGYTYPDIIGLLNGGGKYSQYSDTMVKILEQMSSAYGDLILGLDNWENERFKNLEL